MINKGGFYVRFLNGSLPSFEQIFEDLAPSFVILSQRLNTKLLDKPLFMLDRDDMIGDTRVDEMVLTMHKITNQLIHMIQNNTTEWMDIHLQNIIDVYQRLLVSDLASPSPAPPQENINHNHNSSSSQTQSSQSVSNAPSLSPQSQPESSNNHNHNISSASTNNSSNNNHQIPWFAMAMSLSSSNSGSYSINHNTSSGSLRPTRQSKRTLADVDYPREYPPRKRRRVNDDESQPQEQPSSHASSDVDEEVASLSLLEQRVRVGDFAVQYEPIFGTRVKQLFGAHDKIETYMVEHAAYVVLIEGHSTSVFQL
eukprot:480800_1